MQVTDIPHLHDTASCQSGCTTCKRGFRCSFGQPSVTSLTGTRCFALLRWWHKRQPWKEKEFCCQAADQWAPSGRSYVPETDQSRLWQQNCYFFTTYKVERQICDTDLVVTFCNPSDPSVNWSMTTWPMTYKLWLLP